MSTNHSHESCPVREETTDLVGWVHPDGRESFLDSFRETIYWLRDSTAQIRFFHGGEPLKDGATFNDFYGYLTCIESAIEEAERLCEAFSITRASSLELHVHCVVTDTPALRVRPSSGIGGRIAWDEPPGGWFVQDAALEARILEAESGADSALQANLRHQRRFVRPRVVESAVVWSSAQNAGENARAIAAFRARHANEPAGEPVESAT